MSSITETKKTVDEADVCCASCGIAEVDDIKLKECNGGCDLVKYCNDICSENHREQHDEECKKRKAELRDKLNSPTVVISESARSASCRCRLIKEHLHFTHAAVNRCVVAVFMPMQ